MITLTMPVAFFVAAAVFGISLGVAKSYWPMRDVIYPMAHPYYFVHGKAMRAFLRKDETTRIRIFYSAIAISLISFVIAASILVTL